MANQPPKPKMAGNLALNEVIGMRKEMRKLFAASKELFDRVEDAIQMMGSLRRRLELVEAEMHRQKYGRH